MLAQKLLCQVLNSDALTRGLQDPEAKLIVSWLADQLEALVEMQPSDKLLERAFGQLFKLVRSLSRFVRLWCYEDNRSAALQLAAVERFVWPLPIARADPYLLLRRILRFEEKRLQAV